MKSDEALKKLYIEENDERGQLIVYKGSVFTTVGMLILLALSTVVSGFINEIIFFTKKHYKEILSAEFTLCCDIIYTSFTRSCEVINIRLLQSRY